jgi:hypothetical protein
MLGSPLEPKASIPLLDKNAMKILYISLVGYISLNKTIMCIGSIVDIVGDIGGSMDGSIASVFSGMGGAVGGLMGGLI